jgi:hypothetical protein
VAPSWPPLSRERKREKRRSVQKQCGEEKQESIYIFVSVDLDEKLEKPKGSG